VLRAHLITIYGLCTCTQPGPWMPETQADTVVACDSRETGG
jgi:hypothetical protein